MCSTRGAEMRFSLILAALLPCALADWEFINPPPFGTAKDFHNNPVYEEGSALNIAWSTPAQSEGAIVSVTLWQLNATSTDAIDAIGDMEFVTRRSVGLKSFPWVVGTTKDLSVSNLFLMSIFTYEGETTPDSNSHYFNITRRADAPPNTTPQPSTSTTSTASSTNAPPTSPAAANSSSGGDSSSSNSSPGGLSTAAKVGLGVGIPCALVLGTLAGYLLVRRSKVRQQGSLAQQCDGKHSTGSGGDDGYGRRQQPVSMVTSGMGEGELGGKMVYQPAELDVGPSDLPVSRC